jgi:hypothetical protein
MSRFEGGVENAFDRAAGAVFKAPIEPAQVAKRAEKQMLREKLVGAGKQYAPTLYTVLVNAADNKKLFSFYPTIGAEIETFLMAKGSEHGLTFDGRPLVRFIVDEGLRRSGKFDVIAENVSALIVTKLRQEELEYYGLADPEPPAGNEQDRYARDIEVRTAQPESGSFAEPETASAYPAYEQASSSAYPRSNSPVADSPEIIGLRNQLRQARGADALLDDPIERALDEASRAVGQAAGAAAVATQAVAAAHAIDAPEAHPAAPAGRAKGQALLADLSEGKSFALTRTSMVAGRDSQNDIVINDANASRYHVRFSQDALGTWKLADLNSTNGTLLNSRPVNQALLRDGDQITIGITVLEFRA